MTNEKKVLQLEHTWSVAPLEGDLDTVNSVVAAEWLGTGPTGEIMTKRDLLEMLASNPGIFDSVSYSDVRLNVFDSTAVVTSAFHGVGKELTLTQRYMRVYAKRGGEWQCVATQIIPAV